MRGGYQPAKYQVFDFMELVMAALTFAAAVLTIWSFFADQASWITISGFALLLGALGYIFNKARKLRAFSLDRLLVFSRTFHAFSHMIRDAYTVLGRACRKTNISEEHLRGMAELTAQRTIDLISEALTASTGYDVCVSIKYFPQQKPGDHDGPTNPDDFYVKTLCRSSNSDPRRPSDLLYRVGDNTEFHQIMVERSADFCAQDLVEYQEAVRGTGRPYRNSVLEWKDLYRARIVVPIRISNAALGDQLDDGGFELLGFLCADSESTSAFQRSQMSAYCDFLKAFADALYHYFERLYYGIRNA